jgi:amidohydrolase
MDLKDDARAIHEDLVALRRELHRSPELGLDLPRTQERVLAALQGLPLDIQTGARTTSVTAVLSGARPGPTVLLRGDMDALPVVERVPLDYASTNGNMHACGHDLHTAMLVGAARLLTQHRDLLAGDVVFMFQPGEEGFDGAGIMIDEGVLLASGSMPVAAYALHVASAGLPRGVFTSRPGTLMASVDTLKVRVIGAGGHGSSPHRARDPIPATAEIITALQTFVTRSFDVFDPVVLTVGMLRAGTAHNVIPEEAYFEATIRSFTASTQHKAAEQALRVVRGVAGAHGLETEATVERLFPVTVNDVAKAALIADRVRNLHGEERWFELPTPLTGSEDFSRVLQQIPGGMVFLGATPGPLDGPLNHAPSAEFDDAVLADGAALYADLALTELASCAVPNR